MSAVTDLHRRMLDLQSSALLSLLTAHISVPGAAPGASRFQGERSAVELHRVGGGHALRALVLLNHHMQNFGPPGFEPGLSNSESAVLPFRLRANLHEPGFEPGTKRLSSACTAVVLFVPLVGLTLYLIVIVLFSSTQD